MAEIPSLSITPAITSEPQCTCTPRKGEAPVSRISAVNRCLSQEAVARITAIIYNHPNSENFQVMAVVISFVNIWR